MKVIKFTLLLLILIFSIDLIGQSSNWVPVDPSSNESLKKEFSSDVLFFRILNPQSLRSDFPQVNLFFELPWPDGTYRQVQIERTEWMEQGLQTKFPDIKTYRIADPRIRGSIVLSPYGVYAWVKDEHHNFIIDPLYEVAYKGVHVLSDKNSADLSYRLPFSCEIDQLADEIGISPSELGSIQSKARTMGLANSRVDLRTYRIAVSCTGEYAQFHGGTVQGALSSIVAAIGRVNMVYEIDFAIRLVLIADNDRIIFLDPETDPFNNNNLGTQLGQNQTALNSIIGTANYDIGHVFSTSSSGGLAGLGVVCSNSKARGATGRTNPVGDVFWIDYVAHEIGHQFGANHTFNNCDGNENSGTAFEPGSGSTIMAYAGLCGINNVQFNSDDYFHTISLDEVFQYSRVGFGSTCGEVIPTPNHNPSVEPPLRAIYTIPASTPFELTATASDQDNDMLTYCWEQMDTGPRVALGSPVLGSPLFRSVRPVSNPTRTFPAMNNVLNNTSNIREVLPDYNRQINFRCAVRDNSTHGGGVGFTQQILQVHAESGPFRVLSPSSAMRWEAGAYERIEWDPAKTAQAPVNCATVDIVLSRNGGTTWTDTLAKGIPNSGEAVVWIPIFQSLNCRLRVNASDNVFFAVNTGNFQVRLPTEPTFSALVSDVLPQYCIPGIYTLEIQTVRFNDFDSDLEITIAPGSNVNGFSISARQPMVKAGESFLLDMEWIESLSDDMLELEILVSDGIKEVRFPVIIKYKSRISDKLELIFPPSGQSGLPTVFDYNWSDVDKANSYRIEVSTSPDFSSPIINVNTQSPFFRPQVSKQNNEVYYWRVTAFNACNAVFSQPLSAFKTSLISCETQRKTEELFISATGMPALNSTINVSGNFEANIVELKEISGSHQRISDLVFTLFAPDSTPVLLMNRQCGPFSSAFNVGFSDLASTELICPPNGGRIHTPIEPLSKLAGKPAQGGWRLKISDMAVGSGGSFTGWSLSLCKSEEAPAPFLVNNGLDLPAGEIRHLRSRQLEMSLQGQTQQNMIFTLVSIPQKGRLLLDLSKVMNVGDVFTQADIDQLRIAYEHLGTESELDSFLFVGRVRDGGWIGLQSFQLRPDPDFTSSITDNLKPEHLWDVFPNPHGSEVHFRPKTHGQNRTVLLRITDYYGRTIHESSGMDGMTLQWNSNRMSPGIYFYTIYQSEKIQQQGRIVKTGAN